MPNTRNVFRKQDYIQQHRNPITNNKILCRKAIKARKYTLTQNKHCTFVLEDVCHITCVSFKCTLRGFPGCVSFWMTTTLPSSRTLLSPCPKGTLHLLAGSPRSLLPTWQPLTYLLSFFINKCFLLHLASFTKSDVSNAHKWYSIRHTTFFVNGQILLYADPRQPSEAFQRCAHNVT